MGLIAAVCATGALLLTGPAGGAVSGSPPDGAPTAGVPDTLPPVEPGSALLGCERAADRVVLTASTHLDASCDWTAGFEINTSDVVLDCRGATIRKTGGGRGIEISTPIDTALVGVTVRNCRVEGFLNSLRVTRDGFRLLEPGVEYENGLTGVVIEHSEFRDSRGVGIFIDGYVSDATIRNSVVQRAGSAGIYLETGSRRSTVEHNQLLDNGFRENGPGGQLTEFAGTTWRFWGAGREGVAIDGSYENVVVGNHFEGNSHGGILLYTNCGEFPDSGVWFDRRWPSDRNRIEANTFVGGLNGVWVGQRMSENTLPMECTKPAYVESGLTRITLDYAADNTIVDNHFIDVTYGVRIEDDGTQVIGNTFEADDPTHHAIIVGTEYRTAVLDHPVRDTVIEANRAMIAGNDDPYRWIHGYDGLRMVGNESHGEPTGICPGEQPPRLALIWVITAVPEPPGTPPQDPPIPVVHPELGAIEPCPDGPTPRVAPAWAEADESDGTLRIPVELSSPADRTVTATWVTATVDSDGWATLGEDVVIEKHGTIEFDPGQTLTHVEIALIDDKRAEADEWVVARLTSVDGALPGGFYGLGFGRILDDD
ncbi:MAG: right-handed parallel beta-helix repeat-containing protein [Acidimicrobiales bacterium]|nr:right-handed parallel beta-helix repeat-containing protein [Acidimicrobiales bacterium]